MTYSDNGVDDMLATLLPKFGYACDVGANDGAFNSNTLLLEQRGWLVLCIEPNPLLEPMGRMIRKLWRQVACGAVDEPVREFIAMGDAPWASYSALAKPPFGVKAAGEQRMDVQVLRLDRVLEEAGFPRLDLLTVDVEGWESEVMAGFTIERWKPQIIVLESWGDTLPDPVGYRRQGRYMYDNIYQRDEP